MLGLSLVFVGVIVASLKLFLVRDTTPADKYGKYLTPGSIRLYLLMYSVAVSVFELTRPISLLMLMDCGLALTAMVMLTYSVINGRESHGYQ